MTQAQPNHVESFREYHIPCNVQILSQCCRRSGRLLSPDVFSSYPAEINASDISPPINICLEAPFTLEFCRRTYEVDGGRDESADEVDDVRSP